MQRRRLRIPQVILIPNSIIIVNHSQPKTKVQPKISLNDVLALNFMALILLLLFVYKRCHYENKPKQMMNQYHMNFKMTKMRINAKWSKSWSSTILRQGCTGAWEYVHITELYIFTAKNDRMNGVSLWTIQSVKYFYPESTGARMSYNWLRPDSGISQNQHWQ